MILRNKRAEVIFEVFLFVLATMISTNFIMNYIVNFLLSRFSIRLTMISIIFGFIYNAQLRVFVNTIFNFFILTKIGFIWSIILTIGSLGFSILINLAVWRIIGIFLLRRIKKRIPGDIV